MKVYKKKQEQKAVTPFRGVAIPLFAIISVLVVSVFGLISISAFSKDFTAETHTALADSQVAGITAVISEYTAFLTAAAEVDSVKGTAAKNPEDRAEANKLIAAYVRNGYGVYDIIITDRDGVVFTSYSGDYPQASSFRDDADALKTLASSPAPVSGFYESEKFYCVKPVKDDENTIIGYIILETQPNLISDFLSQSTFNSNMGKMIVKGEPVSFANNPNGAIAGTKFRWGFSLPKSVANSFTFNVWIKSFVVAAGVCLLNLVIILIISRNTNKETEGE